MRNKFWSEPVNRFWLICAFGTLFALCFGTYTFFKESFDPVISLGLISVALLSELLFLIAIIINIFADTKREYLKAFQEINRDLRYRHYQNKNKDKEYKGPNWNDDNFVKISDLKNRVDSFVKASTEYQQVDFKRWKKSNVDINLDHSSQTAKRVLSVIIASFISLFILFTLCKWLKLDSTTISILIKDSRSPVLAALITTVITSPIIFIIWIFRDKNNRVQIENARKDTNLKDFQKLSEWASGFHLPEVKQTKIIKNELKTDDSKDGTKKEFKEETESTEYFSAPDDSNSISRRQGAEALQASAIAQLETFMLGKYGEQFMQPAFLLIHAIWESIITQQKVRYPNEKEFEKALKELHKNPITSALNKAFTNAGGNHLRLFENSLQGVSLIGLNKSINSLNLAGCKLNGIDLSYSDLSNCNFTGTDFLSANLYKINFRKAILQKANLSFSNFGGCLFNLAQLQGANLTYSNVLNDTVWDGAQINRGTLFGVLHFNKDIWNKSMIIREAVLARGAIWDDDPNWLVGKIEDQNLLDKIFKDCEKRKS